MEVSELTGPALDWAVAKAAGYKPRVYSTRSIRAELTTGGVIAPFMPGFRWDQGGPIIEREGILLRALRSTGHSLDGHWLAMYDGTNTGTMVQWVKRTDWPRHYFSGPTPLIAAMRCYAASKLGKTVDVPAELIA